MNRKAVYTVLQHEICTYVRCVNVVKIEGIDSERYRQRTFCKCCSYTLLSLLLEILNVNLEGCRYQLRVGETCTILIFLTSSKVRLLRRFLKTIWCAVFIIKKWAEGWFKRLAQTRFSLCSKSLQQKCKEAADIPKDFRHKWGTSPCIFHDAGHLCLWQVVDEWGGKFETSQQSHFE